MKNTHEIKIRVRYAETDQMGVVHHANFALYLESGRTEWLRSLGISYKNLEENGVMLPVVSMSQQFKKSALYDDEILVKTKLKELPGVKIEFEYEICNQNDEILVLASTVLVFVNSKTMRPIKCPQYILDKILG